jgi:hypothetical protein
MPKVHRVFFLICLSLFGGCAMAPKDPNLLTDYRWIGGFISLEARKLDEVTYSISARGASSCDNIQVMEAWVYMADKLASGRSYEKRTKTKTEFYGAGKVPYFIPEIRRLVTGTIMLQ